jgi:hypothetical protein
MTLKIDQKLNLVIPLERTNGTIYIHSTPIGRQVFEANFLAISKTFARVYNEGLGIIGGPRVCALLLRDTAAGLGQAEAVASLIAEIKRLTNVLAPGEKGWETVPFDEAVTRKLLDEDEASEVENALAFFTVISVMHRKATASAEVEAASKLWGARTESLNSTDFAASLKTPTVAVNTGAMAKASFIPS